nr:hypothetical protein [Tanacetum cinerariifolium]
MSSIILSYLEESSESSSSSDITIFVLLLAWLDLTVFSNFFTFMISLDDSVERATTTAAILDAAQDSGNILKTQSMTMPNVPLSQGIGTCGSPRCQETTGGFIAQTRSKRVPTPPHDSPIPRVNTLRSDEGSMSLQELMALSTTLSDRVPALETNLRNTKKVYDAAKKKVYTYTRRKRVVSTGSEGVSAARRIFSIVEESVSTVGESLPVSTANVVQKGVKDKGYKMEHFKGKRFYKVKEIFDKVYKQVTSFVPMESDMEKERTKRAQEDLKQMMMIVPVEKVYVEALHRFDRDDMVRLWDLVKERYSTTEPTHDKEKALWVELKRLFEPDNDDIL